jgi:hypothetical protein
MVAHSSQDTALAGTIAVGGASCPGALATVLAPAGSRACRVASPLSFPVHQTHGRVTRVEVYIDDHRVKTLRARRISRVAVAAPARSSFTVRIVAFTTQHSRVTSVRHYNLCHKAPPRTRVQHLHRG